MPLRNNFIQSIDENISTLTDEELFWYLSGLLGSGTGIISSYLCENTGMETALHEVVGHGMLGMRLTSDYLPGTGPTYWVSGYDRFKAIGSAETLSKKIKAFFSWLVVPPPSQDGAVGWANRGREYHPNSLANHMGKDGASAWISVTGSLPGLGLNALCVASGMTLRKKHPGLGMGLISFGLFNTFIQSLYTWDAVEKIYTNSTAIGGHDFVNFANRMSLILGMQPFTIALSTAFFFSGFVPLIAVCMYLSEKTHSNESLKHQAPQQLSTMQQALGYVTASTVAVGAVTQLTGVLSITIAPSLTPVALTLKTINPIIGLLSIAQNMYETYKDIYNPAMQLPLLAKIVSCLKLAVTTCMAVSMLVATLTPGMQFLFIPAAIINTLSAVTLSYAKERMIQSHALNSKVAFFGTSSGPSTQEQTPPEKFNNHLTSHSICFEPGLGE